MIIRQICKIIFICVVVFAFGCVEKQTKTETPKETPIAQNSPPEVKEKPTESSNKELPKSYIACGCGCCGVKPMKRCLYHSKGDDLQKIIDEDGKWKNNRQCEKVGCSSGIEYRYCD